MSKRLSVNTVPEPSAIVRLYSVPAVSTKRSVDVSVVSTVASAAAAPVESNGADAPAGVEPPVCVI